MKKIDRTGFKYGQLTVIKEAERRSASGDVYWTCLCECGAIKDIGSTNLKSGKTLSCGCLAKKLSSERAKKLFSKDKVKCKVDGCENDTSKGANGVCGKHYMRMKRYGDYNYITPESVRRKSARDANLKNKSLKKDTYKKLYGRHEHRVIAEQILGRKIKRDEHVHHIDFNKHNNSPENLAVMNKNDHLKLHADIKNKGTTDVKFKRLSEESN